MLEVFRDRRIDGAVTLELLLVTHAVGCVQAREPSRSEVPIPVGLPVHQGSWEGRSVEAEAGHANEVSGLAWP